MADQPESSNSKGTERGFSTTILECKKAPNWLVVDEAVNDDNSVGCSGSNPYNRAVTVQNQVPSAFSPIKKEIIKEAEIEGEIGVLNVKSLFCINLSQQDTKKEKEKRMAVLWKQTSCLSVDHIHWEMEQIATRLKSFRLENSSVTGFIFGESTMDVGDKTRHVCLSAHRRQEVAVCTCDRDMSRRGESRRVSVCDITETAVKFDIHMQACLSMAWGKTTETERGFPGDKKKHYNNCKRDPKAEEITLFFHIHI
ncbi:hypothetical protein K1719_006644 [Acacia pycnantha]|nr:hypothetical protein K1719_006644 [Acacia pycnantha]